MIILDTNVISEMSKQQQNENVLQWFDVNAANERLYTTAINIVELRYGVCMLPDGKRKNDLQDFASDVAARFLPHFTLAFDGEAAEIYAPLAAKLVQSGLNFDPNDIMIAAIALRHNATVATRNVKHFAPCGISVVNPFEMQ